MELRKLTKEELKTLYVERMTEDFPEAELKPLEAMYDMWDRDCYEALLVEKEEKGIGYCLMTKIPGESYLLLDYLSIFKEYRLCGYGSRVLSLLKQHYSDFTIFIESENPDFMDESAKIIAKKRLGFYEKNGAVNTRVFTKIWTVPYINYVLGEERFTEEKAKAALTKIYEIMIPNNDTRKRMVEIPQRPT